MKLYDIEVWREAAQFIVARRHEYKNLFKGTRGKQVLADLANFCRAHESTFETDPRAHALLEGRREVYLRIRDHIELSEEDHIKKVIGEKPNVAQ